MFHGVSQFFRHIFKDAKKLDILNSIFPGILFATGDVLAQQVVEKRQRHDVRRTAKLFFMGSCLIGPGLRVWYGLLDRFVVSGAVRTVAVKKMFCDQMIGAPPFIAMFFVLSDTLGGKSFESIKQNLNDNYLEALKVNYLIWPAVQTFNFYFVPLSHQVLLVNIVTLFWNTYLAYAVSKMEQLAISD